MRNVLQTIFPESLEYSRSRPYNWLTSARQSVNFYLSLAEPRGNGNCNSRPVSTITYDVVVTTLESGKRATRCTASILAY